MVPCEDMAMLGITALPLLAIAVLLGLTSPADAQLTCSMPGALTAKFGLGQCQNEYSTSMSCTLTSGGTAQGVPGTYQGTWSGNSKVATETFGAGGKKWTRSMNCFKDPWISPLKPCTGGVPSFPAGSPAQPQWFPWPGFPGQRLQARGAGPGPDDDRDRRAILERAVPALVGAGAHRGAPALRS